MFSIYGIGNPLLDFVASGDFDLIERLETRPGTMNLVNRDKMESILSQVADYKNIPGGSCANTIRGVAWLAEAVQVEPLIYCGGIGEDTVGRRYQSILENAGIISEMAGKKVPSGCSVIIVTPDLERTMFTCLGACRELDENDLDFESIAESRFLYFTGFMWDTENQKRALFKAVEVAQKNGVQVVFDLADPFLVQRNRDELKDWLPGKINILFGNREELSLLAGIKGDDERIIKEAGDYAEIMIMKLGSDGCMVRQNGKIFSESGIKAEAVDTTAAGDSFAAGFLHGLLRGMTVSYSAQLANCLAAAIVEVHGCDYHSLNQSDILKGS